MSNNDCKKYRELIMENIDGEISDNNKIQMDIHIKNCANCNIYLKKMEKIKNATKTLIYNIPPFMEEKIMSQISGKIYKKPVFSFNFGRVFAYAASFGLVLFISLFLIYNTFDNKIVKLSDLPTNVESQITTQQIKSNEISQKIDKSDEITTEIVKKNTNISDKQENIMNIQQIQEKDIKTAMNSIEIKEEEIQDKPRQDYNIKKIDTIQPGLLAAKVTPIPPVPYNPLLAQEKAIVANNVINPLKGDKAVIRFIVDDTAFVKIVIYDKNIRPVSKILNEEKSRGTYEATWEGKSDSNEIVSEGVYFVYIQIGTRVIKKSIIVTK
ncbi:MAG: zf-HC2 domain-containing protein [Candidatus Goldbacteria bacterium]|nr:zf-HC2 domain-containing protein [Candidatus Goldiibacteriota bacterium]